MMATDIGIGSTPGKSDECRVHPAGPAAAGGPQL